MIRVKQNDLNAMAKSLTLVSSQSFPATLPADKFAAEVSKDSDVWFYKSWFLSFWYNTGFVLMPEASPDNWKPNTAYIAWWVIAALVFVTAIGASMYGIATVYQENGRRLEREQMYQQKIDRLLIDKENNDKIEKQKKEFEEESK